MDRPTPRLTRRALLLGASTLALIATAPAMAAEPKLRRPDEPWRGEPFDDGSYFDDGFGWAD